VWASGAVFSLEIVSEAYQYFEMHLYRWQPHPESPDSWGERQIPIIKLRHLRSRYAGVELDQIISKVHVQQRRHNNLLITPTHCHLWIPKLDRWSELYLASEKLQSWPTAVQVQPKLEHVAELSRSQLLEYKGSELKDRDMPAWQMHQFAKVWHHLL
jgi:hypothetical protein